MGLFDLFKPKTEVLKDKIIFTQKNRINSLENELSALKKVINTKENETKEVRSNFERSKERLIDQIIELSDKFAGMNSQIMEIAHENARMKVLLNPPKRSEITFKGKSEKPFDKKKKKK